jgi:hypothetical protein
MEHILCNLAERLSLCTYIEVVTQGFGSVITEQEQDGLEVTFSSRIREVLRSNLGRDTGSPDIFRDFFFLFLQADAGIVSRLGHFGFLPNSFQFIIGSYM